MNTVQAFIESCPLNHELHTQGATGKSRLKAFVVTGADGDRGILLTNSKGRPRKITISQIYTFLQYVAGKIALKVLRKDRNTSYLFGIHKAISGV